MSSCLKIHTDQGVLTKHFEAPASLDELLNLNGHPVDMPCAGQGKCGKCRVKVVGELSPADSSEQHKLSPEELQQGIRLACRTEVMGDAEVWLDIRQSEKILTDFVLPELKFSGTDGLGLAVDIGTTTLAAYLFDMREARLLAVNSMPNPQRAFAADVTNRLKASLEGKGEALCSCIKTAITELAGSRIDEIKEAVITGNTAMLYLLTNQQVESIAYAPFNPLTKMGLWVRGDQVGLKAETKVWLPHCVSAYVGADITCAMAYAVTQPEYENKPLFLADIGTNGEMALFTEDKILTCSTAAGPAFEGAGIRCGMTAQAGAINQVELVGSELTYSVIGNVPAVGICGSGLLDGVAALMELEIVDESGKMHMTGHSLSEHMTTIDGQPAFCFPGSQVVLTQADIRAVQLAKAAICGGMLTLMEEAGISCDEIKSLQIAGGFGNCIRPESAAAVGLIPRVLGDRVHTLGNGAGAGAVMMLLDESQKEFGRVLSERCTSVELSGSPVFADYYIDCMSLEPCE